MVLEKLGNALNEALRKIARASVVDKKAVKELVRNIQRALLQADVNVNLVLKLSKRIERRALEEKPPLGVTRKEHIIKIVYEELTNFLGREQQKIVLKDGRNVFMLVGVQGSGKTTTTVKLAYHFLRKGFRVGVVCADTYRPGAYEQLAQLAGTVGIPVYGDQNTKDAVKLAVDGINHFKNFDIVFLDTAGRHKDEKGLLEEMKHISSAVGPDEIIMVVDGTMGQQAGKQAAAFSETTKIGSIIVTKLDGSAKGGGALSAVVETGAPIKYIGTGEHITNLEPFIPQRFVGRLLGLGDIQTLLEKIEELEDREKLEKRAKSMLKGEFTLVDVYEQLEAISKMGPLKQLFQMIPGISFGLAETELELGEEKIKKFKVIMDSMTEEELKDPKIIHRSRIKRIAQGSGTTPGEVKELLQQYFMTQRIIKKMRRGKLPFAGLKKMLK
ncbi:MAG: signal recognition particle protein [Methanobacteriota archaeon]|nr:MAG: signal recognition particle protein [Euryarchaeota archaeon]